MNGLLLLKLHLGLYYKDHALICRNLLMMWMLCSHVLVERIREGGTFNDTLRLQVWRLSTESSARDI